MNGWKMNFLLGPGLFSGANTVSFPECRAPSPAEISQTRHLVTHRCRLLRPPASAVRKNLAFLAQTLRKKMSVKVERLGITWDYRWSNIRNLLGLAINTLYVRERERDYIASQDIFNRDIYGEIKLYRCLNIYIFIFNSLPSCSLRGKQGSNSTSFWRPPACFSCCSTRVNPGRSLTIKCLNVLYSLN